MSHSPLRGVLGRVAALVLLCAASAAGQTGPVFPDDSLAAREALTRVDELTAAGNFGEAARVLQQVIEKDGDRVLEAPGQTDLFIPVRARAHELLLANPGLLERYRAAEGARAAALLAAPEGAEGVERSRFLTPAGLEAALRLAQEHLEAARFEAARLALMPLERHPDRLAGSAAAQDAARLAARVARYLNRPEVTAWARAWSVHAGLDFAGAAPAVNPRPAAREVTPLTPAPAFEAEGVVDRPLASSWISAEIAASADNARRRRARGRGPDEVIEHAWIMPACVGDVLYVNDSFGVSAWDRLTLTPLWRARPMPIAGLELDPGADPIDNSRTVLDYGNTRALEDSAQVAVAGGVAVAATGWLRDGERHGDPRIHAFDTASGRPLWSVALAALDPSLVEGGARGPILIDQDTVVVAVRRVTGNRRVTSAHLAGIDLYTGRPRWTRLLATAGSLPYQRMTRVTDSPLLRHGLVYRVDDVGVIAAVEAATGRPAWVRRFKNPAPGVNEAVSAPWASSAPVVEGDTILTLTPAHDAVVRLDPRTGELLAQRPAAELDDPRYLLAVGPWLACVGATHVTFVEAASFDTARPRRTPELVEPPMYGRAVVAADRLLAPTGPGARSALAVIDPADPSAVRRVALEGAGNVVAMGSDVLVVDDARLHSYVSWERADRVLSGRIAADPADAKPALSLVDLAYRAGKPARIVPAADIALQRLDVPAARASEAEEARRQRRQLFTSLLGMLEAAQSAAAGGPGEQVIRDPATLEALTERLGRAAESSNEEVTYLLTLGRLREMRADGPGAAEAYQRILARADLAGANWMGPQLAVRGELEASRRIRDLVARFGRSAYEAFDREVQRESIAAGADPAALERLASAYPAASAGPSLWMRAADEHERAGRHAAGARAYAAALSAAEWGAQLGEAERLPQIGEITGRLIAALQAQDRISAAAQTLDRVRRAYPQVQITQNSAPLSADSLAAALSQRLATLERPARIGLNLTPDPQRLEGWELVHPLTHDRPTPVEHVVMASPATQRVGLWSAGITGGRLQLAWSRPVPGSAPTLLRLDAQAAYFYWPGPQGGSVEKVRVVGGQTEWTTPPIRVLVGAGGPDRMTDGLPLSLPTPLDGEVQPTDLLVAADEQTLLLVERGGGAAAVDLASGKSLWSRSASLAVVHDADINAGIVALAGVAERRGLENTPPAPRIALLDARTGEPVNNITTLTGAPRWIRLTPQSLLIAALDDRLIAWDAATGSVNWMMTDPGARRGLDAWTFDDRLFLLDTDRQLWLASLASGRTLAGPLKGRERMGERLSIFAAAAGPNVLFTTERGFLLYNAAGELIGADGGDARAQLLPTVAAESLLVTMGSQRYELADGRWAARLMLFAPQTGKLLKAHEIVLNEDPADVALLDGAIVITAGSSTVVLPAPVER